MPYIGRSTDGFGVRNRFIYLASSGATSVSGADANGATLTFTDGAYVDVYLNGVLLKPTTDYNTSTANTIAGLSALNTNDEVTVVVYDVFTVADMVSATSGGTFVGNVNFSGNIDVDGTTNLDVVDIDGNVDIAGDVTFNGDNYNVMWDKSANDLSFDDNAKLTFGASNDLSVYHDGSNTYIDESGTGALFIRSSRVSMHKYTGETMINAAEDGAVSLYYDDAKMLETSTRGVMVGGGTVQTFNSGMSSLQVGRGAIQQWNASQGATYVTSNVFYNTSGNWEYIDGGSANVLSLNNGSLYYYHAENGSDGGTATLIERMRIYNNNSNNDNYNYLLANRNSISNYFINEHSSDPYGIYIQFTQAAPDNTSQYFLRCIDNTATRLTIYSDGDIYNHDGTYTQISDERIKTNITDAKSQWDDLKAIRFVNYEKKDDVAVYGEGKKKELGVVAQELEKVCPNLVKEYDPDATQIKYTPEFGTVYEDGDELPEGKEVGDVKEIKSKVKGVKQSILYMKAVKALQEAMARIETLEAKVKALEEA